MEVWRRFYHLSSGERSIVLGAAGALGTTWLGLRLAGFQRWHRLLSRLTPSKTLEMGLDRSALAESAHSIARLESAAARNMPLRTNCLEQSLVLWWLLRRRGIAAELRIGARKDSNRFEAHAWVEWEGEALDETNGEHLHFVPFDGPVTNLETS
jgi:transglutaminase superfamily protein